MMMFNYGGVEMTKESLLELADTLEKEAANKRKLADRPMVFDMPMPRKLHDDYVQQAEDRETEAKSIRRFVERNSKPTCPAISYVQVEGRSYVTCGSCGQQFPEGELRNLGKGLLLPSHF